MKSWQWSLLVGVTTFVIIRVTDVPFVLFLFVVGPLLLIAFTVGSFLYSFRPSLAPEPIDTQKYAPRLDTLRREEMRFRTLGFDKVDEFRLGTIPDALVSAGKHRDAPIFAGLYNFGSKMSCDLVSFLANDVTLTTCSRIEGGSTPRPDNRLLQIFPDASPETLLARHRAALDFLSSERLQPVDPPDPSFRAALMRSLREFSAHVRGLPLWPVGLIWWTLTKHGKKYAFPIQGQFPPGTLARKFAKSAPARTRRVG